MKTSPNGRSAIIKHEGVVLTAYKDSVGVWTIGVGHTSSAGPPKVLRGLRITRKEADEILTRDLQKFEDAVNDLVKIPLNQNEFDALVSLAFNIGQGAFSRSTLLKRLNKGDKEGAAKAFLSFNKGRIGGKLVVIDGLTNRRMAERKLFLTKPSTAVIPETPTVEMSMSLGDSGHLVEELQKNLITLGYDVIITSKFDDKTDLAVRKFQLEHKDETGNPLVVDGKVGLRTSKAISEQLLRPKLEEAKKNIPPSAEKIIKEDTSFIKKIGYWIMSLGSGSAVAGVATEAVKIDDYRVILAFGGIILVGAVMAAAGFYIYHKFVIKADKINMAAKI